jgi:hypothetical protein
MDARMRGCRIFCSTHPAISLVKQNRSALICRLHGILVAHLLTGALDSQAQSGTAHSATANVNRSSSGLMPGALLLPL